MALRNLDTEILRVVASWNSRSNATALRPTRNSCLPLPVASRAPWNRLSPRRDGVKKFVVLMGIPMPRN